MRDHLEAAARNGNQTAIATLDGPPIPDAVAYLWGWYAELAAGRGEGLAGAAPITYADIEAWARLLDRRPSPHEVSALLELDRAVRHPAPEADEDEVSRPETPWPTPKA